MSDQPAEQGTSQPKGPRFPLPTWNKLGEFLVNIMQLERSVEVLKEQNKQLNTQVLALQRQVDEKLCPYLPTRPSRCPRRKGIDQSARTHELISG